MARTTKERDYYKAFALDAELLDQLNDLALEFCSEGLLFTIHASDDTKIEAMDVEDVKKFPNAKNRKIRKLDATTPYDSKLKIEIRFNYFRDGYINLIVSGDERDVMIAFSKLEEAIVSNFSSLSYLTRMPPLHKGIWGTALFIVIAGISVTNVTNPDFREENEILVYAIQIGAVFALLFYQTFVNLLIPHETFTLGAGIRRARAYSTRKTVVFGTLVLGVVASIGASLILSRF